MSLNTQAWNPGRAGAAGREDTDGFGGLWSVTVYGVCATMNSFFDSKVITVQTPSDNTARKFLTIDCPAGMHVTGTAAFTSPDTLIEVVAPKTTPPKTTQIQVIAQNNGGVTDQWHVTGYALCAR